MFQNIAKFFTALATLHLAFAAEEVSPSIRGVRLNFNISETHREPGEFELHESLRKCGNFDAKSGCLSILLPELQALMAEAERYKSPASFKGQERPGHSFASSLEEAIRALFALYLYAPVGNASAEEYNLEPFSGKGRIFRFWSPSNHSHLVKDGFVCLTMVSGEDIATLMDHDPQRTEINPYVRLYVLPKHQSIPVPDTGKPAQESRPQGQNNDPFGTPDKKDKKTTKESKKCVVM